MNERLDELSQLAARDLEGSEERVVNAVMARVRSGQSNPLKPIPVSMLDDALAIVIRFALPIAAVAAIVALASLSVASRSTTVQSRTAEFQPSAALALGLPPSVARWTMQGEVMPSTVDVILAMREGTQ